jgi:hypothetical protein
MPITFACSCGKSMTVGDEHAGKKVRCPDCKNVLVVPGSVTVTEVVAGPPPSTVMTEPLPAVLPAMPAPPTLADRITAVERENLHLRSRCAFLQRIGLAGLLAVTALAGLALAVGTTAVLGSRGQTVAETATASIVLKDGAGKVRAELGVGGGDDVRLKLHSRQGLRAEVRVGSDGVPAVILYGENGKEQVSLLGGPDAGFEVKDPRGDARVQLGVAAYESPTLSFRARELKPKIQLGVRATDLPYLDVYDPGDRPTPMIDKEGNPLVPKTGP